MKTAGDIIKEKGSELICVDSGTTIAEAISIMVENKIGAILVTEGDDIVGIWTERDLLHLSAKDQFEPKTAKIKQYMTADLKWAKAEDSVYFLMDKFLGLRLRHLPVKEGNNFIGMLSVGDALKATLNEKNKELKELNSMVSWEYYENWRWK